MSGERGQDGSRAGPPAVTTSITWQKPFEPHSQPTLCQPSVVGGPRLVGVERLADDVTGYPRGMADYRLNKVAVKHALKLIDAGTYDDKTDWSEAAPSAADANKEIDKESFDKFSEWHLGINPDASEGTKGRFAFPYGDFIQVNRAALIHAKQRAAQNDHGEIEKAVDDLLQHLDSKRS